MSDCQLANWLPGFITNRSPEIEIPASQARLDFYGQRAEVSDSLQFVVWQLNVKMVLEPGQQIESLQTVDTQDLEEIFIRR